MIIYFLSFIIAIILLYFSERTNKKIINRILVLAAILIPSFVAGARDFGVGRDTIAYAQAAYNWAQIYDFKEYIIRFSDSALLYTVWYLIIHATKSSFWLMFLTELFIESFVYLGLTCNKKKKSNVWIGMLLYYTLFYTYSLSLVRQSVAVSILFWAYNKYLIHKDYKKYFILCLIAFTIHPTSIISVVLIFTHKLFDSENYSKQSFYKRAFIYFMTVVGVFGIIAISGKLINYLITINANYLYYQENASNFKDTFVSWAIFAAITMLIYIVSFVMKSNRDKRFYNYTIFLGLVVFWTNLVANNSYRISLYFLIQLLVLISDSICMRKNCTVQVRNSLILSSLLFFACFAVWYVMVVRMHLNDIYPYKSIMLGIVR